MAEICGALVLVDAGSGEAASGAGSDFEDLEGWLESADSNVRRLARSVIVAEDAGVGLSSLVWDGLGFVPSADVLGASSELAAARMQRDWRYARADPAEVASGVRPAGLSFCFAVPGARDLLDAALRPGAAPMLKLESFGTTTSASTGEGVLAEDIPPSHIAYRVARRAAARALRASSGSAAASSSVDMVASAGQAPAAEALVTRALLLGVPRAAYRVAIASRCYIPKVRAGLGSTLGASAGMPGAWTLFRAGDSSAALEACRAVDRAGAFRALDGGHARDNAMADRSMVGGVAGHGGPTSAVTCLWSCMVEHGHWPSALSLPLDESEQLACAQITDECTGLELFGLASQSQWQGQDRDLAARARQTGECVWVPFRIAMHAKEGQKVQAAALWRVAAAVVRLFAQRNGLSGPGDMHGWWVRSTAVIAAIARVPWPLTP